MLFCKNDETRLVESEKKSKNKTGREGLLGVILVHVFFPAFVEIVLEICVDPNYFQSYVQQSLMQVLGTGVLPNGTNGLFNPDNFTFGQTVYLSQIYAAARSVPGVTAVTALTFQPEGVNTTQFLLAGVIKLGSLQVARLANDPNFPDHGQLTLVMQGGK